jgi:hypothetical protein
MKFSTANFSSTITLVQKAGIISLVMLCFYTIGFIGEDLNVIAKLGNMMVMMQISHISNIERTCVTAFHSFFDVLNLPWYNYPAKEHE